MNKHDRIKNLRPIDNSDEAINQAKSRGKIEASIKRNLLETLRTRIDEWDLIDKVVLGVNKEVGNGKFKNAIELLKIAKEPEKQELKLDSSEIIAPVINVLPVKGNNEL